VVKKYDSINTASGMNPPSVNPSNALVAKNPAFPLIAHCEMATTDHAIIWNGTHRSTPTFFPISCDGSSANRKQHRLMVEPLL
jgi:hypothetical protein